MAIGLWELNNPEKVKEMKKREYLSHKEAYKARAKERQKRLKDDLEFKAQATVRQQKYYQNHRSEILKKAKDRKRDPDKAREQDRQKYEKIKSDPIRYRVSLYKAMERQRTPQARVIKQQYRARKRKAPGLCTSQQWAARVKFYGWRCFYCTKILTSNTLTQDHRIPLSKGGSHWPSNLVPACSSCNCSKGAKSPKSQM